MASESSLLGTPSIYLNPLKLGYLDEQEKKYGLLYSMKKDDVKVISKAISILKNPEKESWNSKRQRLLDDKIDTTDFMTKLIKKI